MIGAIAGDIIGSLYETKQIKTKDFPLFTDRCRFTDDTVLTLAVADCVMNNKDFTKTLQSFGRKYPKKKYGSRFCEWFLSDNPQPFNSFGNGSAMRVSSIGFYYNSLDEVLYQAKQSAMITHNHPEGIKGAQSIAAAIFLAKINRTKEEIRTYIINEFGYNLNRTVDQIRQNYSFDVSCQGSVPESIICFLDSVNYEDAIRNAVSLGGDSDTLACMTGGIAQASYKDIPGGIIIETRNRLNDEFLAIIDQFNKIILCLPYGEI